MERHGHETNVEEVDQAPHSTVSCSCKTPRGRRLLLSCLILLFKRRLVHQRRPDWMDGNSVRAGIRSYLVIPGVSTAPASDQGKDVILEFVQQHIRLFVAGESNLSLFRALSPLCLLRLILFPSSSFEIIAGYDGKLGSKSRRCSARRLCRHCAPPKDPYEEEPVPERQRNSQSFSQGNFILSLPSFL